MNKWNRIWHNSVKGFKQNGNADGNWVATNSKGKENQRICSKRNEFKEEKKCARLMIADSLIAFSVSLSLIGSWTMFYVLIFQTLRYSYNAWCLYQCFVWVCVNRSFVSNKWCRLLALLYYKRNTKQISSWGKPMEHEVWSWFFFSSNPNDQMSGIRRKRKYSMEMGMLHRETKPNQRTCTSDRSH